MKKSFLLLAAIAFFYATSYAQAPSWEWARSAGGANSEVAESIAVDASGNTYVTGTFVSPSITFGTYVLTNTGSSDIFVVKYDTHGNVLWATSASGTDLEDPRSIAVDASGNAFITGNYYSPTLTFGTYTLINTGVDLFLAKFDSNGNVAWAKSAGGPSAEYALSVAVDLVGNPYLTGYADPSIITFDTIHLVNTGVFIVKYDVNGNALWAQTAGRGTGMNYDAESIAVDASGNAYIEGNYDGTMLFGSDTLTSAGLYDVFLAKYDANGIEQWARSAGGASYEYANSDAVDVSGNIYITGYFMDPHTIIGNDTLAFKGVDDIFLAKYDAGGNVLWATSAGDKYLEHALSIKTDVPGNVYMAGYFNDSSFTIGSTTLVNASRGHDEVFVAKYDPNGNVVWAKSAGGTDSDDATSVATDAVGNVYTAGLFISPTLSFDSIVLTNANSSAVYPDLFVAKLGSLEGIDEISNFLNVSLFPNPATNRITITLPEKANLEILNVNGQIIRTIIHQSPETSINIEDLSRGVYLIKAITDNGIVTKKFIKE
jgi:hypothetical protein